MSIERQQPSLDNSTHNIQPTPTESSVGYVMSHLEYDGRNGPEIDLGLATSPIGPAPELKKPLEERSPYEQLSKYSEDPLHTKTKEHIIEGIGLQNIDHHSIIFDGNGSYGAGDEIIRALSNLGYGPIIAPDYSFPNVSQWAIRHGNTYVPGQTDGLSPLDSLRRIIDGPRDYIRDAIIYIDYPNNPYGVADAHLLRNVISYVKDNGGIPFVDLAFGEVLGEEFTNAIQYTIDHGGVCTSSLSKTQGLPGLRTGYAIIAPELIQKGYSNDEQLVFGLNREAEYVYNFLYANTNGTCLAKTQARRVAQYNTQTNIYLYEKLQKLGLLIGETDQKTAIQVVIAPGIYDFYQRLTHEGVRAESLKDYQITLHKDVAPRGYRDSAVRMLTPGPNMVEEVVKRVQLALR